MFRLIHFTLPLALVILSDSVVRAASLSSSNPPSCPAVDGYNCLRQSCAGNGQCGVVKFDRAPTKYRIATPCRTVSGKLDCAKQCFANYKCKSFEFYEYYTFKDPSQNHGPGTCSLYSVTVDGLNLQPCAASSQKDCRDSQFQYYDKSAFVNDLSTGFYLRTSSSNPDYNQLWAAENTVNNITTLGYTSDKANALLFTLDSTTNLLHTGAAVINQDADMERSDEPIYLDSEGSIPADDFVQVTATIDSAQNVLLSSGERTMLFANADRYSDYIGLGKDTGTYSDLALKAVCAMAS